MPKMEHQCQNQDVSIQNWMLVCKIGCQHLKLGTDVLNWILVSNIGSHGIQLLFHSVVTFQVSNHYIAPDLLKHFFTSVQNWTLVPKSYLTYCLKQDICVQNWTIVSSIALQGPKSSNCAQNQIPVSKVGPLLIAYCGIQNWMPVTKITQQLFPKLDASIQNLTSMSKNGHQS